MSISLSKNVGGLALRAEMLSLSLNLFACRLQYRKAFIAEAVWAKALKASLVGLRALAYINRRSRPKTLFLIFARLFIKSSHAFNFCLERRGFFFERKLGISEQINLLLRRKHKINTLRKCRSQFVGVVSVSGFTDNLIERFDGVNGTQAIYDGDHIIALLNVGEDTAQLVNWVGPEIPGWGKP